MAFRHGIYVADAALAIIFIQPLAAFYWRGTWDIWGLLVNIDCRSPPRGTNSTTFPGISVLNLPCIDVTGIWICGVTGCLGMTLLNIIAPILDKHCTPEKCTMAGYVIITRVWNYIFGFLYFGHWKGAWDLIDYYTGDLTWRPNLVILGVSYGVSMLLKTSKLAQSVPWESGFDIGYGPFKPRGWFRSKPKTHGLWFYCMDQFLSQLIPLTVSIIVWRCLWNILDDSFLARPTYTPNFSSGMSLVIGTGGIILLMALSIPASKLSAKLDDQPMIFKIIWEDFFFILVNGFIVFTWRGMYNLIAGNIYPGTVKGSWICHGVGFGGLLLLNSSSCAFDNSIDLDGEEEGGDGIRPAHEFFQHWFQNRLEKEAEKEKKIDSQRTDLKENQNGKTTYADNNGFDVKTSF